jgi:ankyrin repeat protein
MDIKKKLIKIIELSDSEFFDYIENNPSIIHEKDYWKKTLIHYACGRGGQKEKIKMLLEKGAVLNQHDENQRTAYDYVNTLALKNFIDTTLIDIEKHRLDSLLIDLELETQNQQKEQIIKKVKI